MQENIVGMRVLHKFNHGLGDCVMFRAVLNHLRHYNPDWENYVVTGRGKHTAFKGLAECLTEVPDLTWGKVYDHDWPECWQNYRDVPGTKAAQCIQNKFHLKASWSLLTYDFSPGDDAKEMAVGYVESLPKNKGFVLIHYEGNTSRDNKNLSHGQVIPLCDWLISADYTPVILDWDFRSSLPDQKRIFCPNAKNPIWQNLGSGDFETLSGLCSLAKAAVTIDSGPQKVCFATGVPTVAVWVRHHPLHYCDNVKNAIHVVPNDHLDYLRGNKGQGGEFFYRNYKYITYPKGKPTGTIIQQLARLFGISYNPMADSDILTATSFDEEYYEQHKDAGLDYTGHGEWQITYGQWIAGSLSLSGKKLLDVGCACGSIACGIAKAGVYVSGCDVNEHMIRLGRERWLASTLKICDAVNMHYWKDDTFDCVHSNQVFEHFKPELVPFILRECHRVTKPDGILLVILDTEELFARQKRDLSKEDPTHTCVRPMAWWEEHLEKTGWEVAPDLLQSLKKHQNSYFKIYDWECFICRKK